MIHMVQDVHRHVTVPKVHHVIFIVEHCTGGCQTGWSGDNCQSKSWSATITIYYAIMLSPNKINQNCT